MFEKYLTKSEKPEQHIKLVFSFEANLTKTKIHLVLLQIFGPIAINTAGLAKNLYHY